MVTYRIGGKRLNEKEFETVRDLAIKNRLKTFGELEQFITALL